MTEALSIATATRRMLPFHEAGTRFDTEEPFTPEKAVIAAGLDFPVEVVPSYDDWQGEFRRSNEYSHTRRADTGDLLGAVKGTYKPIQNLDAFSFLNVVTESGEALIDSGRQIGRTRIVGRCDSLACHYRTVAPH